MNRYWGHSGFLSKVDFYPQDKQQAAERRRHETMSQVGKQLLF
jgi:hypothetical protein